MRRFSPDGRRVHVFDHEMGEYRFDNPTNIAVRLYRTIGRPDLASNGAYMGTVVLVVFWTGFLVGRVTILASS